MWIAIGLGVWTAISIIVTPIIGYFLFVLDSREHLPQQSADHDRPRASYWSYVTSRRRENVQRRAIMKLHRREVRGPRAG
jgi:hypothetical protein